MWPTNYIVKITREGKIFSVLTLLIGMAAVNTGNNLLYLILGMMSSFIITSGLLSTLSLRKIQVYRTLPEHVFATKPFSVKITLVNPKRLFPSFSLLVEDLSQTPSERQKAYFIKIPAKSQETLRYTLVFNRRGLHRLGGLKISTGYPFGLCMRARVLNLEETVLVYPRIDPITDLRTQTAFLEGEWETARKGMGTDFKGIRDYTPGDNSRCIHWKTTAKSSRLMVKEFEDEDKRKVSLVVDTAHPSLVEGRGGEGAPGSEDWMQALDKTMDIAASYAWHFVHQNFQVQLLTPSEMVPFNQGPAHLFRILRVLALQGPSNGDSYTKLLAALQKLNDKEGLRILISISGKGSSGYKTHFSKIIRVGGSSENGVRT